MVQETSTLTAILVAISPTAANTEEWTAPSTFTKKYGQLFFNSTANNFKETITDIPGATWASGGSLNAARSRFGGARNGSQTAGLVFGANNPPYGQTEEYNGSSWTEQTDINTARYISYGGGGTQTAALMLVVTIHRLIIRTNKR